MAIARALLKDPEILILDKQIDWGKTVSLNKKVKLVVYPRNDGDNWGIKVARDNLEDYNSDRIKFPKSWWNLRNDDLIKECSIEEAIFCGNGGWIAAAKTKDGAVKMAQEALLKSKN